jgi:hypothetical protein
MLFANIKGKMPIRNFRICMLILPKIQAMYDILKLTHSYLRYFILVMLIIVIVLALVGWLNKRPFTRRHDKVGLFLFICTHTQLLIGLILYFVSPVVIFSGSSMKNPGLRYWLVEHNFAMLIAIVLITLARTTSKKMPVDQNKHKRMFLFNTIALIIILVTIALSGRGIV